MKYVMIDSHTFPDADFHQEKEILSRAGIECILASATNETEAVSICHDAEFIGINYFKVTANLLNNLPKLKAIIRYGIGYDVVDVKACSKHKIALCNLPTYCLEDVATHTMALILDLSRKTSFFNTEVKKGRWDVGFGYINHRLSCRTLGLIGFGNIARKVAQYARAFDLKILAYDPYLSADKIISEGAVPVSINELYAHSDIISLHIPGTTETVHTINTDSLSRMKHGVIIINTSRGSLIDNQALAEALASGQVLAAGLDVIEGEPINNANHPLVKSPNTVITPHSAYNSFEASDEQHREVAETVVKLAQGQIPANTVNKNQL